MTARVTLVSRQGCHLCDTAREVIRRVCDDLDEEFVEVDVDEADGIPPQWSDEVPVTLVDGRQHDFWRVDEARLRTALQAPSSGPSGA